jgi:hypothetical protein
MRAKKKVLNCSLQRCKLNRGVAIIFMQIILRIPSHYLQSLYVLFLPDFNKFKSAKFQPLRNDAPTEGIPTFGLAWSNDPESYVGGGVATGRVSLAGQVKGDDPD